MVRAWIYALMGLYLMLAAASTEARELEFFVENRLGGDSNVFRRPETGSPKPAKAAFWEISPRLTVRDQQDELEYDLRYQPTYVQLFATDGKTDGGDVSGLDHSALGTVTWNASSDWTLGAEGNFFRNRRLRQNFVDAVIVTDPPVLESADDERITRGRGSAYVSRSLDARTSIRGSYSYDSLDFERSSQSDSESHSISGSLTRALSPKTTVGVSLTGWLRESKASVDTVGDGLTDTEFRTRTTTADFSFTLARQFNERLDLSITAGPSFIDTENEVSGVSGDTKNNDNSMFIVVSSTYRWKGGQVDAGYTRSQSSGGGSTTATSIVDDVSVRVKHAPTRDWAFRFSAGWNHRVSLPASALLGLSTRVDQIRVSGAVERYFTPRLALIAQVRVDDQSLDQSQIFTRTDNDGNQVFLAVESNNGTLIATGFLSLRYTFESFIF